MVTDRDHRRAGDPPPAAVLCTQIRNTPREVVAAVPDPEIPTVTIEDLGILRDVREEAGGRIVVTITPTYSGCPAMDAIRADIRAALRDAGCPDSRVDTVLSPAWSTDMITEVGRAKLAAAGIAPPHRASGPGVAYPGAEQSGARGRPVPVRIAVRCPRCGSPDTEEISRFGSTACKALWRCRACAEPFDHMKAI